MVFSVPSGSFGNITSRLIANRMGLPAKRFIAANNRNCIFFNYLKTGEYKPQPSVQTIANAMDVGDPSNFVRILDLYNHSLENIKADISAYWYNDDAIRKIVLSTYKTTGYLLDPHGACGYQALKESLNPYETGIFLETAHPAKFLETVEQTIGESINIPAKLQAFMKGEKQSIGMNKSFDSFKQFLMED